MTGTEALRTDPKGAHPEEPDLGEQALGPADPVEDTAGASAPGDRASRSGELDFTVEIHQNRFLPAGSREVHAIVTVTGTGGATPASGGAAEVIIIDTSASMVGERLFAAKRAAQAAVDALREDVDFAIIAGSHEATMVYPHDPLLVRATAESKASAKAAITRMTAHGGTAIGKWLRLAHSLFADRPYVLRHAILLADGKNAETPEQLDAALAECSGVFTCDCRGIGTDWEVAELRRVASALLGTVDIVADPAGLKADFLAMVDAALGKSVGDVALRVWSPRGAAVRFVKQVYPTMVDLTTRRAASGPLSGDYPTGAWGAERRDYHIAVQARPAVVGEEMLVARVSLVRSHLGEPAEMLAQGRVLAVWIDDEALSTQINPQVAGYTGQAELAQAIQEGLAWRREGEIQAATIRLGRAAQLAAESGNTAITTLLKNVVEIEDAATGTVRLRSRIADADEMALDSRSVRTMRG